MCGRYTHLFTWKQLHRLMDLAAWPDEELAPRFNVAPTQMAPVVRLDSEARREGTMLRWGLVPAWADDESIGSRMINARSETAHTKPSFRSAFAQRRCLVPTSGFYEWKTLPGGKRKQPYWIGRTGREPLVFAGLWERWTKGGTPVESFTILTTDANPLLRPLHDRMPVILEPEDWACWLDPESTVDEARALLRSAGDAGFDVYPVSTRVNSPKVDEPSLIARADLDPDPGPDQGLWSGS